MEAYEKIARRRGIESRKHARISKNMSTHEHNEYYSHLQKEISISRPNDDEPYIGELFVRFYPAYGKVFTIVESLAHLDNSGVCTNMCEHYTLDGSLTNSESIFVRTKSLMDLRRLSPGRLEFPWDDGDLE